MDGCREIPLFGESLKLSLTPPPQGKNEFFLHQNAIFLTILWKKLDSGWSSQKKYLVFPTYPQN